MKATSSLPVVVFLILTISQGVLSNMGGRYLSVALYGYTDICAVRGSSVVISCSFKNPCNLTISKIYWGITTQEGKTPTDLRLNAAYKGRVQYFWKNDTNCTMEIQNVKKEDSSSYQPIFEIKNANQTRKGQFEINLTVTDLTVTLPQPVIEGHAVNLSCMSSCSEMDKHKVIWRKNGQDLPGKQKYRKQLEIQNVSIEDEGLYSCALKGYKETATTPVKLNVMFPPKNTSAVAGPGLTLTCSSVANPPVEIYTWFKVNESTPVGSGQQYSITNISSEDGGQYYCEARNKYGAENSTAVSITVADLGDRRPVLYPSVGVSVCGAAVLICVLVWIRHCRMNKRHISIKQDQGTCPARAEAAGGAEEDVQYVVLYASVLPKHSRQAAGVEDDIQYASVQFKHSRQAAEEKDDVLYASVQRKQGRQAAGVEDDVQYACVQSKHNRQAAVLLTNQRGSSP
ncbi:Fc receptor-like protein 4 [Alosa sapidissima]|uniref:Fc receptor-like protein 4 n=1 Tax=Alosa sapidissima TaxID=34773 RepID=UPI001C094423|nr:Fc receptor-like protein 4 [Alosa sapidissima]